MGEKLLVQSLLSLKHRDEEHRLGRGMIEQQGNKSMEVFRVNQTRRS